MQAPVVIPFCFPGVPGVRCAFQTRMGGASKAPYDQGNYSLTVGDDPANVLATRAALKEQLGYEAVVELNQVHGTDILLDPPAMEYHEQGLAEADGSTTTRPGLALVIKTADCQPILLAHEDGKHVMALHSGWRGNRANYPALGVEVFCREYGLDPAEVWAVRGPSLGPTASEFVNYDQEWGPEFDTWHDPATRTVDLWRMTRDQLTSAGLKPEKVLSVDLCTHTMTDTFFSYRRERNSGRMAGLIWIER